MNMPDLCAHVFVCAYGDWQIQAAPRARSDMGGAQPLFEAIALAHHDHVQEVHTDSEREAMRRQLVGMKCARKHDHEEERGPHGRIPPRQPASAMVGGPMIALIELTSTSSKRPSQAVVAAEIAAVRPYRFDPGLTEIVLRAGAGSIFTPDTVDDVLDRVRRAALPAPGGRS